MIWFLKRTSPKPGGNHITMPERECQEKKAENPLAAGILADWGLVAETV